MNTEVTHVRDVAFAPLEDNAHAQKGLTTLPSLQALHTDGILYGFAEGITWQGATHTRSDSGCINAPYT